MLVSWQEFLRGKRHRKDVADFSLHFTDNILGLHDDLVQKTYRHGGYQAFRINDPKPRNIHKASIRDRLVHHALYRLLAPYFEFQFIQDSYSCRPRKGTHRAMDRFRMFARKVSRNGTRTAWVLKCDIRKFFASIDQGVLRAFLQTHIPDDDILWLLGRVIASFHTDSKPGIGLPLGNLTSQLLINIYLNELDHFVKRGLKACYYVRYADDFVILSHERDFLLELLPKISCFLEEQLKLRLHPSKVRIASLASGIDFLGWVHFPYHRVLRTSTKRRIISRLMRPSTMGTIASYAGLMSHGHTRKLAARILKPLLLEIVSKQG